MPDKDGDESKSTKSVVNKKQKQMMGEEGYDIARDMGRVRPSKDKKDATTMPPSKEMEKTRKVNKGPSALDIVKKKYKGQIMNVEELDLTKVAEAFGGYIVEAPVDDREEKKNRAAKRLAKAAGINIQTQGPEQAAATQAFKDMRMSREKKFSDVTPDVKSGMRATAAGKGRNEPVDYDKINQQNLKKVQSSTPKNQQSEIGKSLEKISPDRYKFVEPDDRPTGETTKEKPKKSTTTRANYPKTRSELEAKRKEYEIDPKTNRPSAAGIEKYARRTKQSNLPLSQDDLKTAEVRMAGTGEKGTDVGKYGGRLGRRRGKNMPSLDQVKADIDKRNPTYTGQSGGQLPFPTRQSSYKSPVDDFIERIKRAKKEDPEGLKKGLQDMPDDPRMAQFKKDNPTTMQQFVKKPQSVVGATGGLIAKTLNPALAGTEAMQRYKEGRKGDAAISAVQSLGGPIGFGAGVVNYIRSKRAAAAQTEPQPEPKPKTKTKTKTAPVGDGGGKKPPKTKVTPADDGGKGKTPSDTAGSVDTALNYQIYKDATKNVKDILKSVTPNLNVRKSTKTGRISAGT